MRPKDCAYIVERLAIRFMALVTDHERQLTEHRAAFGARTEADAKIIAGLRSEIVAARMAVLERDSLMSERDGLLIQAQDMRAEMQRLSAQLDCKQHPVKVGEWVRRTDAECDGIYFGRGVIAQVLDILDAPENQYTVSRPEWNGYTVPWAMQYCEPCDPPEATHDTEAGKAAAESAVRTEPVAEEIKVGDLGEVFQATTRTLNSDVGITGCVSSIHLDPCHGGFLVKFDPSTQSRRSAGMQAFGLCDVRKVTT